MEDKNARPPDNKSSTFIVGEWTVESTSNQLVSGDKCITIEPKMMDVLICLCQHSGKTVSAEQLLIACWPGTFYGDAPVQKCIAGLRKKLGCSPRQPTYIETIFRRGYKVIADVTLNIASQQIPQRENFKQWTQGSPYLGLNSFEEVHTPIYFGRTKAIAEVIQSLHHCIERHCHFLLLLGKSGSGKSSLIRAGVLPCLSNETGFAHLRVRQHHIVTPKQSFHESPTASLIHALNALSLLKPDLELLKFIGDVEQDPEQLKIGLVTADANNDEVADAELIQTSDNESKNLKDYQLLVIDQFEQFLLDDNLDAQAKQNLVTCIKQLARCENLLFIAMLRNDFYADCLDINGFNELKDNGRQYDLQAASPFEIAEMIRRPAIAAGLTFEHDATSGEQLDDILLAAAVENPDALPLLEYTLNLLYQQRSEDNVLRLCAYYNMGGIEGAIAQQAEKNFNRLPPKVQHCWDKIMLTLVRIDHNDKRQVTARKIPVANFNDPVEKQFIQSFLDAQLFVTILHTSTGEQRTYRSIESTGQDDEGISGGEEQFITIAHEALLKHWQRISKWVVENSVAIQKREQLADDCQHWLENNKANDALLNSKQKVLDGVELSKHRDIVLNENELKFVARSKRFQNRKKHLLSLGIVAVIGFSILTWFQSKQVAYERDVALSQSERAEAISNFLTDMFNEIQPANAKGKDILVKDILVKASKNISSTDGHAFNYNPSVEVMIQTVIGGIYTKLGLLASAEKHLTRALNLYKIDSMKQSKEYLNFLNLLIDLYSAKFEYKKIFPLVNESIAISKTLYGEDHRTYLNYLDNLGDFYQDTGSLERAQEIYSSVYDKRKQLFGNEDADTIDSLVKLATLAHWQGKYLEAEKMYKTCIEFRELHGGRNHPNTLSCLSRLGSVYETAGKYEQAVPIITEHIQRASLVLGEQHFLVLRSMHNLADSYRGVGRVLEAENLFRKTLRLRQDILGKDHIETLQTQMKLARLLRQSNRYSEALPLIEDAVKKQKARLGSQHPTTLIASQELADLYRESGQTEPALSLYQDILTLREQVLGDTHPDLKGTLLGLAKIYLLKNDSKNAESYFYRGLTMAKAQNVQENEELIDTLKLFIAYFSSQNNIEKSDFYEKKLTLQFL